MVDKSLIGSKGGSVEMAVERGKIREFARATKSSHPAYLEDRQPVSPPTFLTTSSFWSTADAAASSPILKLGLDLRRILHGEQEFVFHGEPPRAGTELIGETLVGDIYEKEGKRGGTMLFVTMVTEFKDAKTGELVAESRSTLIQTAKTPTEG